MAARTVEQHLAALRAVDAAPSSVASRDALKAALAFDKPNCGIAIAAAAKRIAEHRIDALGPELADAFERLLGDTAVKRDPSCRGKIAIARALHDLDDWEERVFVRGLRVVQLEGMPDKDFKRDDTAAELRGICGLAHAHFARGDALDVLAALLADEERTTRLAAAQAIGDAGRRDGTALLRYFLLASDEREPEVLAAAFESLFAIDRDGSTEFAIEMLAHHDERGEAAALALGGARVSEAIEALGRWCSGCRPEQRYRVGYLAIALARCDAGNALLLDAIATRGKADAVAAAQALATFRDDANVVGQLREALAKIDNAQVRAAIATIIDG